MKGAFAGGVLHALNRALPATHFDLVVAVSSGACSAAYYVTMQRSEPVLGDHNLSIWRSELAGRKLISVLNPLRGRTFLDQEYLVDDLFGRRYPLQKENFEVSGLPEFRVAVSNLRSRRVEYVRATSENIFDLLKAATSLPIATRGRRRVEGRMLSDAAVLNPLPLGALIAAGYRDITIVMNSPLGHTSRPFHFLAGLLSFPRDPGMARLMNRWHHHHFNRARDLARNPPDGVHVQTIAPDRPLPVRLISTGEKLLRETVGLGIRKGEEAAALLRKRFLPPTDDLSALQAG